MWEYGRPYLTVGLEFQRRTPCSAQRRRLPVFAGLQPKSLSTSMSMAWGTRGRSSGYLMGSPWLNANPSVPFKTQAGSCPIITTLTFRSGVKIKGRKIRLGSGRTSSCRIFAWTFSQSAELQKGSWLHVLVPVVVDDGEDSLTVFNFFPCLTDFINALLADRTHIPDFFVRPAERSAIRPFCFSAVVTDAATGHCFSFFCLEGVKLRELSEPWRSP
jgi:hypothetical protein